MRVILTAIGTSGDSHPMLRLGGRLIERGHQAVMVGSGYFQPLAERLGVRLVDVLSRDDYLERQRLRTQLKGRARVDAMVRFLTQDMRNVHAAIRGLLAKGPAVVAAQNLQYGARILRDQQAFPLATVHVETMLLTCRYDAASPWPGSVRWLKPALNRLAGWLGDRALGPSINAFRAELGLPPVRDVMQWWNSPELVIGLFPDWFGPRAEDVPGPARIVGFPVAEANDFAERGEVERFLETGTRPIVFGQTTSFHNTGDYFSISAAAAQKLGRRALLLGSSARELPEFGPEVRAFAGVPHGWLLPRCAALVHHGGIGTAAAALQAGVPQLVVPQVSDQGDNSRRLAKLGVAAIRSAQQYTVKGVARDLERLLADASVAERCRHWSSRAAACDGLQGAAEAIEELAAGQGL